MIKYRICLGKIGVEMIAIYSSFLKASSDLDSTFLNLTEMLGSKIEPASMLRIFQLDDHLGGRC